MLETIQWCVISDVYPTETTNQTYQLMTYLGIIFLSKILFLGAKDSLVKLDLFFGHMGNEMGILNLLTCVDRM